MVILFVFVSCTSKQSKSFQNINCDPIPQQAIEGYDTFRTFDEYKMTGVDGSTKDTIQVYAKYEGDTIRLKNSICRDSTTLYIKSGNWWKNRKYYHMDATEIDKNGSNVPQRYDRYIKTDTIIELLTEYFPDEEIHRFYLKTRNKVIIINSDFSFFADKNGAFNPDLVVYKYAKLPNLNKVSRFYFREKGYYTFRKVKEKKNMTFSCELKDEIVRKSIIMNSLEEFGIESGLRIEVGNIEKKEIKHSIRKNLYITEKDEIYTIIKKEIKKRKIYSKKGKYTVILKLKISPQGTVVDSESVREPSATELVAAAKSIVFWLSETGTIKRNVDLGVDYIYVPFVFESEN